MRSRLIERYSKIWPVGHDMLLKEKRSYMCAYYMHTILVSRSHRLHIENVLLLLLLLLFQIFGCHSFMFVLFKLFE